MGFLQKRCFANTNLKRFYRDLVLKEALKNFKFGTKSVKLNYFRLMLRLEFAKIIVIFEIDTFRLTATQSFLQI